MKALYPPFLPPRDLPKRVLVVAPHPDDEVFGCGGMLAWHGRLGATVRILVLSDGAAGDPGHRDERIVETRRRESRAAGAVLGFSDYRFLDLCDGHLGTVVDLHARIARELEEFQPELVYGPSPQELHPDHRATSRALIAALARGPRRRVFLYGVNAQVTANVLFDTTAVRALKLAAVQCFESQIAYHDLVAKGTAVDISRTVNVEDAGVVYMEGYAEVWSDELSAYERELTAVQARVLGAERTSAEALGLPRASAVISTWNKCAVVCENLRSIRAQSLPFAEVIVVDNASHDGTAERIAREFPEVRLIVMPHSAYGACETFNVGFASATGELVAILDDDVVLPPSWLEQATLRLLGEPKTTAVVSTETIEPGMPPEYIAASKAKGRRYMSTFRGCGSLARRAALAQAGYYDERLFIYGNERDLTCRLLNLGYRVLQDPEIEIHHMTPFGIQMGKRSLYYHARNAWLTMLKYAPLEDLLRLPFLVVSQVLLRGERSEAAGAATDATGTIGIGKSIRETPGAAWILCKAALSVLWNAPYCLKHRQPVKAPDFQLPLG
ncbi:MAG: glycosyltransferase [Planctomycetes bacterium]|nr:glycosyltransferase [Planctomycetota bacterium]